MKETGIKETVLNQIRDIGKRYNAEKIVLFGSRARGDYCEKSDIDLAVFGGDFSRIAIDIDEDTDTLLMFDVVDMGKSSSNELMDIVEKEGIVLYEEV